MSDAAIITDAPATTDAHDLKEVFRLRAWARALLYQAGEYALAEAVDVLQADAERDGLVDLLGQDSVQNILAEAFAAVRDLDEPMADEPSVISPTPESKPSSEAEPGFCDVCCCDPCVTPGFCGTCRTADAEPHVIAERAAAQLPPNWHEMDYAPLWRAFHKRRDVLKSTLDTAEHLVRLNDPKRFEAWLLQHAPAERAAIVAHLKGGRHA
jgi:hypothetical protein